MTDQVVRNALLGSIDGGQAFMTFDQAVAEFPTEHFNTRPLNLEYSFWHLLEHIRICNRDILDYIANPDYRELHWPDELWPAREANADAGMWMDTVQAIREDMASLREYVSKPESDLESLALHANGDTKHTLMREILVVTDHNAYHLGEFAILRHVMGLWSAGHE